MPGRDQPAAGCGSRTAFLALSLALTALSLPAPAFAALPTGVFTGTLDMVLLELRQNGTLVCGSCAAVQVAAAVQWSGVDALVLATWPHVALDKACPSHAYQDYTITQVVQDAVTANLFRGSALTENGRNTSACFLFDPSTLEFVLTLDDAGSCPTSDAKASCTFEPSAGNGTGTTTRVFTAQLQPNTPVGKSDWKGLLWTPALSNGGCSDRCGGTIATMATASFGDNRSLSVQTQSVDLGGGCSQAANTYSFAAIVSHPSLASMFLATVEFQDASGAPKTLPVCFYFDLSSKLKSGTFAFTLSEAARCPITLNKATCISDDQQQPLLTLQASLLDTSQQGLPTGVWSGQVLSVPFDVVGTQPKCAACAVPSFGFVSWTDNVVFISIEGNTTTSCSGGPQQITVSNVINYQYPALESLFVGTVQDQGRQNVPVCMYFSAHLGRIALNMGGDVSCPSYSSNPMCTPSAIPTVVNTTTTAYLVHSVLPSQRWIGTAVPPMMVSSGPGFRCQPVPEKCRNFKAMAIASWSQASSSLTVFYNASDSVGDDCDLEEQTYTINEVYMYGPQAPGYFHGRMVIEDDSIPVCFLFDVSTGRFVLRVQGSDFCPSPEDHTSCSSNGWRNNTVAQTLSASLGLNTTSTCACQLFCGKSRDAQPFVTFFTSDDCGTCSEKSCLRDETYSFCNCHEECTADAYCSGPEHKPSGVNIYIIIGAAVGGAVLIAIIVVVIFMRRKKRQRQVEYERLDDSEDAGSEDALVSFADAEDDFTVAEVSPSASDARDRRQATNDSMSSVSRPSQPKVVLPTRRQDSSGTSTSRQYRRGYGM